ncbi:Phosphoribosyl-ATP pyrophosphatase [Komagataeibacter saccharivorans]|uniref:Phosphoribosyl-ATP pyrophosphatase n=1 Tax=Komagataeibacter saccharivorans TaxID=265959 RepID=A0A347WA20_9PROT|nr:hypothetical protein [Komagataeibacter saccharivorans]AXY21713.1 Phosphoribosyl-ATP pyrophosphatase [Komagataeibacter saccharivorans]
MSRPHHTPASQSGAAHALGPFQDRSGRAIPGKDTTQDPVRARRAGRAFTCAAEQCVMDLMTEDRAGLIAHSADVLVHLLEIWAAQAVSPEDVWIELDRRTRMGNLLLALNTTERKSGPALARKRPWKIRTTKLP